MLPNILIDRSFLKQLIRLLLVVFFFGCNGSSLELNDESNEVSVGEFIDNWTYKVNPETIGSNFTVAEFQLWVPENFTDLKAILVLAHSFNSNGLGLAKSTKWQAFAAINNLALLSVHLESSSRSGYYGYASEGSGQALLTALEEITSKNNLKYIADLPFLLKGYSAGGVFSYYFSDFMPERVLAFANIRGGGVSITSDANKLIPGIMLMGKLDVPSRNQAMKTVVERNRNNFGLWSYAVEPYQDHFGAIEDSDELIKVFFTMVLDKRLSEQNKELLTLNENSGFLGDNISKNVFSYIDYPYDINFASWLINEDFAYSWKLYQME